MKHLTDEDLILMYYNEPDTPPGAGLHLSACPECRTRAADLARTLDACREWSPVDADAGFDERLWRRVAAEIDPETTARKRAGWKLFAWAPVFAVLLIAAFLAGRATKKPSLPMPIMAGLSNEARERVLAISVADHLDRAEILLTDVANGGGWDSDRAADLVSEGRLLRETVARSDEHSTLALLDDIERFLVELANEPDRPNTAGARALRRRLDDDSLVFKIRIIESNLRTRGQRL